MALNPVAKDSLKALIGAMEHKTEAPTTESDTVADFVRQLLAEPDKKKRKQMMKDFSARRADVAKFLAENEELINSEAEMALVNAAVGTTVVDEDVSYKGGRRIVRKKKRRVPPNVAALNIYLKNRMPDKYSDKPQTEVEIEDLTDIERMIDGEDGTA